MSASSNGFEKDPERARKAGQKSSRAIPKELRVTRGEFAQQFEQIVYRYMDFTLTELKKALKSPDTPAKDMAVISLLVSSISKGDHSRFNFLLDRTVGKVVERVETETRDLTREEELDQLAEHLREIAKKPE